MFCCLFTTTPRKTYAACYPKSSPLPTKIRAERWYTHKHPTTSYPPPPPAYPHTKKDKLMAFSPYIHTDDGADVSHRGLLCPRGQQGRGLHLPAAVVGHVHRLHGKLVSTVLVRHTSKIYIRGEEGRKEGRKESCIGTVGRPTKANGGQHKTNGNYLVRGTPDRQHSNPRVHNQFLATLQLWCYGGARSISGKGCCAPRIWRLRYLAALCTIVTDAVGISTTTPPLNRNAKIKRKQAENNRITPMTTIYCRVDPSFWLFSF